MEIALPNYCEDIALWLAQIDKKCCLHYFGFTPYHSWIVQTKTLSSMSVSGKNKPAATYKLKKLLRDPNPTHPLMAFIKWKVDDASITQLLFWHKVATSFDSIVILLLLDKVTVISFRYEPTRCQVLVSHWKNSPFVRVLSNLFKKWILMWKKPAGLPYKTEELHIKVILITFFSI